MPHAENTANMSTTAKVNGDKPQSATLDHITSYPLVAESLQYYQQNPLGAKSISLAQSAYSTFAAPVLPYFQTPYSYVHPYLAKADSLGDDTLSRVDSHFPYLKNTDFETLRSNASAAAHYPFKVAGEGKDYVFSTYDDEYKKTASKDQLYIVHTGKAIVSTELKIASDAIHAFADWLGPKKDQAEEQLQHLKKMGEEKAEHVKKHANEKKHAMTNSN